MTNANGTECWTQSSDQYIEESVKTVQEFLRSKNNVLPNEIANADAFRLQTRIGYWTVPGIGTHDSNGRYQQAIAPGGIGRQESSPPIQLDVSIGMPVPQGPSGLILLSVIHIEFQYGSR
jgi:hypothetical protein